VWERKKDMTDFFDSSPALKNFKRKSPEMKHPWDKLEIGKSFVVKHSEGKLETLRASASKWGKKLQRRFIVVYHNEDIGFEVGRVE
jgi:hypothetical protein